MKSKHFYNIVQLSDLHLTANDGDSRSEPRLFGALKGMNETFRKLLKLAEIKSADLIVVTGDVTDRGVPAAWKIFWNAIHLENLSKRIIVIPGNHDVCSLSLRLPGRQLAKADLQKAIEGLRMGQQPYKFPWAIQVNSRIVVFGINSNNLGNLSGATNAMGEIDFHQFEAFARRLRAYQNVPIKIVILHHSPNIPENATAKRRQGPTMTSINRLAHQIPQDRRRALRLLCIAQGVRLIMHGHLHRAEDRRVNSIRIVGAPASTEPSIAPDPKYSFWRYSIGMNGRIYPSLCSVMV